jgi:hypothetical protein
MDTWLGDIPLCRKYPILFYLALNQNIAVFDVTWNDWAIRFRVRLQSAVRDKLASLLNRVALNDEKYTTIWRWSKTKKFTIKSVYEFLISDDSGNSFRRVWKAN